jgi:hypothetical protein
MAHEPKKASARNIAAIARLAAPRALAKIEALMDDPDPRVAIDAAKHVLDRAIGKPIAMSADVTDRLDEFTDDELDAAIADLRARIESSGKAGTEAGTPPSTH